MIPPSPSLALHVHGVSSPLRFHAFPPTSISASHPSAFIPLGSSLPFLRLSFRLFLHGASVDLSSDLFHHPFFIALYSGSSLPNTYDIVRSTHIRSRTIVVRNNTLAHEWKLYGPNPGVRRAPEPTCAKI